MSGNSVIDKQDARPAAPATKAADDPVTPVFGNGAEKSIFGENGERLTGREADDYAVTAIKRFVDTFSRKLEQLAKKDISLEKAIGALGNARSISNKENLEDGKKKKEEYESAMRTALRHAQKALEEQLDAIQKEINRLQNENTQLQSEIDENKIKIEALTNENAQIENLLSRLEHGESEEDIKNDETYKKAAEQYRKATGKDTDKIGVADLLLWQQQRNDAEIKGLNAENEAKKKQIEENKITIRELEDRAIEYQKKLDELEAAKDIQDPAKQQALIDDTKQKLAETKQKIAELKKADYDIRYEQISIQESHSGVKSRDEFEQKTLRNNNKLEVDEEVGKFMKEYVKAQTIKDDFERLSQEQKLVAGLSKEAAENISWEESTQHLFSQDYFKPLENNTHVTKGPVSAQNPNWSLG